jgi:hypothetical protein
MSKVKEFQTELKLSARYSIDAFLESNPKFMEMGKQIIAVMLSRDESYQQLYDENDKQHDWYRYLFDLMVRDSNLGAIQNGHLAFITYNYDRSLEFFLFNALRRAFSALSEGDCISLFERIPIVHIHGQLGPAKLTDAMPGREYRPISTAEQLQEAADSIRIVSEDIDKDPSFVKVHRILKTADVVLFLGFGYHRVNLQRLQLMDHCRKDVQLAGTVFGMTSSEISFHIISQFKGFSPFTVGQKPVLDFVREGLNYFTAEP